jgi:16S rRNA (guanine966-N2)-methyltransferase
MRVIAGSAGSIPLAAPEGFDTRPTTDKIKETLFNILNFSLAKASFKSEKRIKISLYY